MSHDPDCICNKCEKRRDALERAESLGRETRGHTPAKGGRLPHTLEESRIMTRKAHERCKSVGAAYREAQERGRRMRKESLDGKRPWW